MDTTFNGDETWRHSAGDPCLPCCVHTHLHESSRTLHQRSHIPKWRGVKAGLLAGVIVLLNGDVGIFLGKRRTETIETMCDKVVGGHGHGRTRAVAEKTPMGSTMTTPVFSRGLDGGNDDASEGATEEGTTDTAVLSGLRGVDVDQILAKLFSMDCSTMVEFGDAASTARRKAATPTTQCPGSPSRIHRDSSRIFGIATLAVCILVPPGDQFDINEPDQIAWEAKEDKRLGWRGSITGMPSMSANIESR